MSLEMSSYAENFASPQAFRAMVQHLYSAVQAEDAGAALELSGVAATILCRFEDMTLHGIEKHSHLISWETAESIFEEIVAPLTEETKLELCARAFSLYMQGAERGDGESMFNVGFFYQVGLYPVAPDAEQAVKWNHRAFDAGFLFAANNLYTYYSVTNREKAKHYLRVLQEYDLQVVKDSK